MGNKHLARLPESSSRTQRNTAGGNRVLLCAAAAVPVIVWALWPAVPRDESVASEQGRRVVPASDRKAPHEGTPNPAATLAPPAEGLESRLRHCYISGFKASGPLADAAAKLTAKIRVGERKTLTAEARNSGDAPVHLNFSGSLPAWALLEMMALQSGTVMELSGKSVVFSRAKKPVPVEGMLTRTERFSSLRTLLTAVERKPQPDEFIVFEALVREALGSNMLFEESSKTAAAITGTPRDVEVLTLALQATTDQPAMMSVSVEMVSIPTPGPDGHGIDTTGLSGILRPEEIQEKLLPLRTAAGVQASILHAIIAEPGDEIIISTQLPDRSRPDAPVILDVKFSVAPSDLKFCKLYSEISMEQPTEDNPAVIATQQRSTTTNLFFGQTLALGNFKQDDTHEVMIFVTPAGAGAATASAR